MLKSIGDSKLPRAVNLRMNGGCVFVRVSCNSQWTKDLVTDVCML